MKRILFFSLWLLTACLVAEEVWQPEKTWVFAVGVLAYEDSSLATWPDEGRVDARMIAAFQKRGVPEDRIVFIKNKSATRENLVKRFAAHLSKAGPGDTFIFFYAGHGGRDFKDAARPVSFIPYDSKNPAGPWAVQEVLDSVEKNFKGARVLFTADCCHSGALVLEAVKRKNGNYGVLTSAPASSRSTGNWTFTQCLVDMLEGNALLDLNSDGKISFAEIAKYSEEEMAFGEGQLASSTAIGNWSRDMVMSQAGPKKPIRVGERLEGLDQGKWWPVKILDVKEGSFFVTWIGWDRKYDAWISEKKLRAWKPRIYQTGTRVEIEWDKVWYPGKVLENKVGLHLVHYEGYPSADDEWVPNARLRPAKD